MPLYEGLAYGGDKNVVVVDIGNAYTKCGLAGETGPRCIIPSEVKSSRTGKITKLWDYTCTSDLHDNLKDFLYVLYFKHLLVNPKDRRVVVVESLLCPSTFREALASVLFRHYEASSVLFAPSHMACLLVLGTSTGMVMDIGYKEALVIPVYEGIPVLKAWQSIPFGGKAIHSQIEAQLKEHATVTTSEQTNKPFSSCTDDLNEEVLENIKVQCCFVTSHSRAKQIQDVLVKGADINKLPTPPPDVDYPLDGKQILHINGKLREHVCEILFEQDRDERSVATLILDALLECPIDLRRSLSENIVIMGGTAMIPGFHHRLRAELYELLQKPKYKDAIALKVFKFHKPPSKENYTAWLGGAVIGALETLQSKSLSREAYLQTGKVADWCNIAHEPETEELSPVKAK
ncbi:actin-related protein 10-like [Haliotis asinina]|uniref:actin-related protein 10-like n=1 Tax=Haliotis asinina TaxID=109174 RepID=UPI00353275BF